MVVRSSPVVEFLALNIILEPSIVYYNNIIVISCSYLIISKSGGNPMNIIIIISSVKHFQAFNSDYDRLIREFECQLFTFFLKKTL